MECSRTEASVTGVQWRAGGGGRLRRQDQRGRGSQNLVHGETFGWAISMDAMPSFYLAQKVLIVAFKDLCVISLSGFPPFQFCFVLFCFFPLEQPLFQDT